MKVIKDSMSVVEATKPWHTALRDLQLAINCSVSKATGKSSMELLLGRKCSPPGIKLLEIDDIQPSDNVDQIRLKSKERMDERASYDKAKFDKGKAQIHPFKQGDFVLMRRHERHTTKLGPKYEGPMEVIKVLSNDRYKVKHINLRGSSEKFASHDSLRPAPLGLADPFDDSNDAVWDSTDDDSDVMRNDGCNDGNGAKNVNGEL